MDTCEPLASAAPVGGETTSAAIDMLIDAGASNAASDAVPIEAGAIDAGAIDTGAIDAGAIDAMSCTAAAHVPIVARVAVSIRPAVMGDIAFIDRLQKQHSRELGFLPRMALEGKVRLGQVIVAEVGGNDEVGTMNDERKTVDAASLHRSSFALHRSPVGYLIAADRYQKRDEIGYVTQMCIEPAYRRSLVAAALLQAQFDRSAYGCRLYGCWCAQDLKANEFWEAMGFTAIAFRTGSMTKGKGRVEGGGLRVEKRAAADASLNPPPSPLHPRARVHIFWQKRIRANDRTTPWWYPSQTGGGEIREDRLVFPIMPGVHWRDVGPVVLEDRVEGEGVRREGEIGGCHGLVREAVSADEARPGVPDRGTQREGEIVGCQREGEIAACHGLVREAVCVDKTARPGVPDRGTQRESGIENPKPKKAKRVKGQSQAAPIAPPAAVIVRSPKLAGGMWFESEGVVALPAVVEATVIEEPKPARTAKEKAPKAKIDAKKIDPRLTAMARELRDRWTEQAETIAPAHIGKHDVKRIAQTSTMATTQAAKAAGLGSSAAPLLRLEQAA